MTEQTTDLFDGSNEFPMTTIAVTTKDGETQVFERAWLTGIWSGRAIVAVLTDEKESKFLGEGGPALMTSTVQNYLIDLANIDRLELGAGNAAYSGTRQELEAPGMLGEDDELNMSQND